MKNRDKIKIKNFRSLKNIELELKPISLLFGPNGSGKSSFIKALMFFYENTQNLFDKRIIKWKLQDICDLENFHQTVLNNDEKNDIVIEYNTIITNSDIDEFIKSEVRRDINNDIFDSDEKIFLDKYLSDEFKEGIENGINIETVDNNFELKFNDIFQVLEKELAPEDLKQEYEILIRLTIKYENNKAMSYITIEEINTATIFENISSFIMKDLNINYTDLLFKEIELNNKFYYAMQYYFARYKEIPSFRTAFLYFLDLSFSNRENPRFRSKYRKEDLIFLYKIANKCYKILTLVNIIAINRIKSYWLPTTRKRPLHNYKQENNSKIIDDYYGLLLKSLENEFVSAVKKTKQGESHESEPNPLFINNFLKVLSNLYGKDFNFERIIYDVEKKSFFVKESERIYNLAEGSSGLMQILPVLIKMIERINYKLGNEILYVFENGINESSEKSYYKKLIIEQPELHLHPRLQSILAKYFVKNIYHQDYAKDFIIETHSEHLVRKLQVLIAKGELDKDDVAVYYFDNKNNSTNIKKMEFEDNGFFKEPWPYGFFDDSYNLTKELLRANKN